MEINEITDRALAAAVRVHRRLGPGLLEGAYKECHAYEMRRDGLRFQREVPLPLVYDGVRLDCAYRLDFLVEGQVVLEIKAERALPPVAGAQLLTYLRVGGFPVGLLINFHARYLGDGAVRRVVNDYRGPRPGPRRGQG